MFQILRMFIIAALHFAFICSLKLSCESKYPPRYWTVEHLSIVSLMTLVVFALHFESCCPLLKYINSFFDSFSLSLTKSIHALISLREGSRVTMVSCSCLVPDLNCLHIEWSSTNPVSVRSSFSTSCIVEAYATKRKAPVQIPGAC